MSIKNLFIVLGLICYVTAALMDVKSPTVRIIEGTPARPKQFPHMVLLGVLSSPGGSLFWCGGTLIDKNWVLTAAHCLYNYKYKVSENGTLVKDGLGWRYELTAYIGGIDKSKRNDFQQIHAFSNPNFHIHSEFNMQSLYNDIGLVHLPEEAKINEFVQVISLPPPNIESLDDKSIIVAGWGISHLNPTEVPNILQYADVRVMKIEECHITFPSLLGEKKICIDPSHGKNICLGDSGGPAIYEMKNGKKVIVGIISSGDCVKNPSELTRVSYYLDWIQDTIQAHSNKKL